MTLSAGFPLSRFCGFRHANTRWFPVSATYTTAGLEAVSNAMAVGFANSRPSSKFGVAVWTPKVSLLCPNSREGNALIAGDTWAKTGTDANVRASV